MKKPAVLVLFAALALILSLACSASGISNLFATPTHAPTQTPTPPPTGTSKINQPDGSILFSDYDNQYEIIFPEAWTTIDLDSDDWSRLADSVTENNPDLEKTFSQLKDLDPDIFRFFAFDFRSEHIIEGSSSSINIVVQNNDFSNRMPLKTLVDVNASSLPQMLPGSTLLNSKVTVTKSGMDIGYIEATMPITNTYGNQIVLYEKLVFIKAGPKLVIITLATHNSLQEVMLPEYDGIIDSFKILE